MKINQEMILLSSNVKEFSNLVRNFNCSLCPLREEAWVRGYHTYPVPNDYDPQRHSQQVDLVLVGGALGPDEGKFGMPFVGPPGQLIRGAIESIMEDLGQKITYMFMNICMCHPEGNRIPHVAEAEACKPFLFKQLSLVNPNAVLLLGSTATRHVLQLTKNPVMKEHIGKRYDVTLPHRFDSVPAMVAYHPSYVHRQLVDGSLPRLLEEHYITVIGKAIQLARRYK
jgi:uracil-DNA glycosylase family 4